jgi:hypothetical protein
MSLGIRVGRLLFLILSGALLLAQDSRPAGGDSRPQADVQKPAATQPNDELSQIRDDLNRMESLNMNMSSEIEFLHDQNLQILLRTNSQMWTILIRDMRRQLQQEEQRRSMTPAAPKR